jgi:hypothetical protein
VQTRGWATTAALAFVILDAPRGAAVRPLPVQVSMDAEQFDISAEGNTVTGRRHAPVPYESLSVMASAVAGERPLPAAVRLVRSTPPQIVDYVFCVTDDGLLVVGEQVRTLQLPSSRYVFTEGTIKRAYPALEATAPWTWIVDIPLGREVTLTLEVKAMMAQWPVRAVAVTPRLRP